MTLNNLFDIQRTTINAQLASGLQSVGQRACPIAHTAALRQATTAVAQRALKLPNRTGRAGENVSLAKLQ
jgi:hypothetical protein